MIEPISPEVLPPIPVADWIASHCSGHAALEAIEQKLLTGRLCDPFLSSNSWHEFCHRVRAVWDQCDHVIIRGLPTTGGGVSALLATLTLASHFRPYRDAKVVKHFALSPWTHALSHTTREGHFHTDLNTKDQPPRITAIQCHRPDPAEPEYGVNRVARLVDLLAHLKSTGDEPAVRFLTEAQVTMVSDTEPGGWTGCIVNQDTIRFHPETLRAAWRRSGKPYEGGEELLVRVTRAAMAVSAPITLASGDLLLVSNVRALHYRGECTVRFINFPREFLSREVYVFHMMDEPASAV